MEQSSELVSVAVYLAILAFGVAWFLLPRRGKRRKITQSDETRRGAGNARSVVRSGLH